MFNYDTLFFNFYIISRKNIFFFIKTFLEPVHPDIGSSGAIEMLQSPNAGSHTATRVLFTSPYSTPNLDRIHDTHFQTSTPQSDSRDGGRDEDHGDVVERVSYPRSRHVTSMMTLPCTFLVTDNEFH
jgi:hypothetical protein